MIEYIDGLLVDVGGEVISDNPLSPKFNHMTKYEEYASQFPKIRYLEPAACKSIKPNDMAGMDFSHKIVEKKLDGHRSLMYITENGNRFFSRRVSVKTNWWAENTDCVPHLRDMVLPPIDHHIFGDNFYGTVIDGEFLMPTGEFEDLQGVFGALPENAFKKQVECGFAIFNAFDCLFFKGVSLMNTPLYNRKLYLTQVFRKNPCQDNFKEVSMYGELEAAHYFIECKEKLGHIFSCYLTPYIFPFDSLRIAGGATEFLDREWANGNEGIVIKDLDAPYDHGGKRKSWGKVKEERVDDLVIMGYEEPTKIYDGKTLNEKNFWDYWETPKGEIKCERLEEEEAILNNLIPITKPYAMGWIGAIVCGVYKGDKLTRVASVKGIPDKYQEVIKNDRDSLVGTVIEVKSQRISDSNIKSLRHPRFNRWRTHDKDSKMCKWEDIN